MGMPTAGAARPVHRLVVGASGLLGGHLLDLAPDALGTYRRQARPGLVHLDLAFESSADALLRRLAALESVIIATNPPSLEWCEREPAASRRMVADLDLFLGRLRRARPSCRIVFLSTDYVFDGTAGPYDEYDESAATHPLQEYGRHKRQSEEIVAASGLDHWIVRTSVLYGESRWEPSRPLSYPLQVVAAARSGGDVVATDNLWSKATEARSLAAIVWSLADRPGGGVIHCAGAPAVTRLELARLVLQVWELAPWPGLRPVSADAEGRVPGQTLRRPRNSSLATQKLEALTGRVPLDLASGLAAVRERWASAPADGEASS
jgi:dTDP-4-dehydrorhamnose reductase